MMAGRLVLLVGPRGSGKSSLVAEARRALADDPRFDFPLRIISQPAAPGDERLYRTVTPAQYDCLRRAGRLGLCWRRDGVNYALPAEIDAALGRGQVVVAEATAGAVAAARRRYRRLTVVAIAAPAAERRRRLARLDLGAGDAEEAAVPGGADLVLPNAGRLRVAARQLVMVLDRLARPRGATPGVLVPALADRSLRPTMPRPPRR